LLPRRSLCRWLLAGLIAGLGCGPRVAEVQGTVKLNGTPLSDIEVYFIPDGQKGTRGPRAAAVTDPEGRFRLDLGTLGQGALIGHHRVVLVDRLALAPVPDERVEKARSRGPQPSRIPEKYMTATSTPLRAEVHAYSQTIDLEITNP
jgi:hypothetical protein